VHTGGVAERMVEVGVQPVPAWIDARRLLGDHAWQLTALAAGGLHAQAALPASVAAELAARLRGLGLDGAPLQVVIDPPPGRTLVRAARLAEARARRLTTPGFTLRGARAAGEGRYSLTPEVLALALAGAARGKRVVDACCGSGGNAIGFARAGCSVTAIDLAPERIAEARHNVQVYGVAERVRFLIGDARQLVPELAADILFIDPPWGDVSGHYDKRRTDRQSLPLLDQLLNVPLTNYGELRLKLPCSFDTRSIPGGRPSAWFGEAAGDRQRVKFIELVVALARAGAPR
jgi:SAM-dependent methyltransferase